LIIIQVSSVVAMISFTFVLMLKSPVLSVILAFLLGMIMIPLWPIGIEYVAEITFPIEEDMSTGMLMTAGQVVGIFNVLIITRLILCTEI